MEVLETFHILATAFNVNRRDIIFGVFVVIEIHDIWLVKVLMNIYDVAASRGHISGSVRAICNG